MTTSSKPQDQGENLQTDLRMTARVIDDIFTKHIANRLCQAANRLDQLEAERDALKLKLATLELCETCRGERLK